MRALRRRRDEGTDARRRGGNRSGALGAQRYPAQQCRGQHCWGRQAAGRADRGGLRPRLRDHLRGTIMACKHVLPIMRLQRSGAIINISSVAARENSYPLVTYKATKAAMIAFTEQLALQNAPYGIRANCILPGLMDTPMAVDTRARASNRSRAEVAAERDAKVPLRGRMGTAWDVANAALFLASDEANFITGVALPVDGGALVRVG